MIYNISGGGFEKQVDCCLPGPRSSVNFAILAAVPPLGFDVAAGARRGVVRTFANVRIAVAALHNDRRRPMELNRSRHDGEGTGKAMAQASI